MRSVISQPSQIKKGDDSEISDQNGPTCGIHLVINTADQPLDRSAFDRTPDIHLDRSNDNSYIKTGNQSPFTPDTTTADGIIKTVQKEKSSQHILTKLAKGNSEENKLPVASQIEDHVKLLDIPFEVRLKFVRKVYILLSLQLLITMGLSILSIKTAKRGFGHFQLHNPKILFVVCAFQILLSLTLLCVRKVSRTVPYNYICLFLFTLVESYMISAVCAVYSSADSTSWVVLSAAMTAGVVIGLTIYAFRTKTDFTIRYGLIYGAVFIAIILVIATWILKFSYAATFINAGFAVVYCLFIIYDTQQVIGKNRHGLHIDDYVLGVVILYTDIIGLFISILQMLRNPST